MAASLILPVSGPYTATYNAAVLGTQNDDGYVLTAAYKGQEVNLSDAYGMTLVEAIYRGLDWRMRFRSLEWSRSGILTAMNSFGSSGGQGSTFTPIFSNVGHRYSFFSRTLILTAVLESPPTFVQTMTALSAIIAPQSNIESILTSKVREAPIEMVLLPYLTTISGTAYNVAFTTT